MSQNKILIEYISLDNYHRLSANVYYADNEGYRTANISIEKSKGFDGKWRPAEINWSAYGGKPVDFARLHVQMTLKAIEIAEEFEKKVNR